MKVQVAFSLLHSQEAYSKAYARGRRAPNLQRQAEHRWLMAMQGVQYALTRPQGSGGCCIRRLHPEPARSEGLLIIRPGASLELLQHIPCQSIPRYIYLPELRWLRCLHVQLR